MSCEYEALGIQSETVYTILPTVLARGMDLTPEQALMGLAAALGTGCAVMAGEPTEMLARVLDEIEVAFEFATGRKGESG